MPQVEKSKALSLHLSLRATILISYLRLLALLSSMSTNMAATDYFNQYGDSYARPSDLNHRFSAGVKCSFA